MASKMGRFSPLSTTTPQLPSRDAYNSSKKKILTGRTEEMKEARKRRWEQGEKTENEGEKEESKKKEERKEG